MLCLLFAIGRDRYALDTADVAEVLPLVDVTRIPHAPAGVAGVLNFRGSPVPVVDLGVMFGGTSAPVCLSTRLILVRVGSAAPHDRVGSAAPHDLIGLIAEQVTSTLRCQESDFLPSGVAPGRAPYLGPVLAHEGLLIQRIHVDALLPPEVRAGLSVTVRRDEAAP
jgi:chemotaxis-related protein WspB